MVNPRAIALHLAAWVREELDAQKQLLAVLDEQAAAAKGRDLDRLERAGELLQEHGNKGAVRARRRDRLLGELASQWSVPRSALTLASVAERLGSDGEELQGLRKRLRAGTAEVLLHTRKVGVLVAALGRVTREVVQVLLTDEDGSPLHNGGGLVDAEA